MFYHRKLPNYSYSTSSFSEIIEYSKSPSAPWKKGIDQNGTIWTVDELSLQYEQFDILGTIFSQLNLEFKKPSFFLSRVSAQGLCNHIDHRKWGNLGFPLYGDFETSSINFVDPFNQIVETLRFDGSAGDIKQPFAINTRMTHMVRNDAPPSGDRVCLMMDLFEWPGHVFEKIDTGSIFHSTPTFFSSR